MHKSASKNKKRILKQQSAFEFITTYGWAILILAVVIIMLYYFVSIPTTAVPNQCKFVYGTNCQGVVATSANGITKITMVITNSQNFPIFNPQVKFATDSYGNLSSTCLPSGNIIQPGGEMICNMTMSAYVYPGTTITGTAYLNVTACPSGNINNCQPKQTQTYKGSIITRVTSQATNIHLTSTSTSSTSTSSTSTSSTSTSSTSSTSTSTTSTSTIGCTDVSLSYSTPGGPYAVTVPAGCSAATVTITGGGGGRGGNSFTTPSFAKYCTAENGVSGGPGGGGASISGSISVTAGETLYVWTGGGGGPSLELNPTATIAYSSVGTNGINGGGSGGSAGFYEVVLPDFPEYPYGVYCSGGSGGGGGGYSAIGTSTSTSGIIAVAGGGAGGGGAGEGLGTSLPLPAGAPGGSSGSSGSTGNAYSTCNGAGGGAGTTTSGGSAGPEGSAGSAFIGGDGANGGCTVGSTSGSPEHGAGGGAGSGYYGGGGGGSDGGGGGGGSTYWSSSFTETSENIVSNTGVAGNNGIVEITWS